MWAEERRKAFEELEKSEKRFADLYDFAPVGYFSLDENHQIVRINRTGAKMLGLDRRRLLGIPFSRVIAPEWQDLFFHHVRQCLDSWEQQSCELKLKEGINITGYIQLESKAFFDDQKKVSRINSALIDITSRKTAEQRIITLSRELLISQEKERRMLSCELHDRIAQQLSSIKMRCDRLTAERSDIPSDVKSQILELSGQLADSISSVRDLSYELTPPDLKKGAFPRCLFNYCNEFSKKTGIEVEFFSAGMETVELEEMIMVHIYRLVQEGLNNILKHARAGRANIICSLSGNDIVLRVIDNGQGFDVDRRLADVVVEKRMGIRSMEERARLLGGKMSLESTPGQGTRIHIRFPYRGNAHG